MVGIDISDLSVKVAEIERKGSHCRILSLGSAPIPSGAMRDGEIKDRSAVVSAIRKAILLAGPKKITSKKIVCSMSDRKAFSRLVSLKSDDTVNIEGAVRESLNQRLATPLEHFYYNWKIVGNQFLKKDDSTNILITAISKFLADDLAQIAKEAGLHFEAFEAESVANSRSLLGTSGKSKMRMIVDIGDRKTTMAAFREGIPCFVSSVPICGQSMTLNIAGSLGISQKEAENMKMTHGIASPVEGDVLLKILVPMVDVLGNEIKNAIQCITRDLGYSSDVHEIVLAGGGAATKGLSKYLANMTGCRVVVANPLTNLEMSPEELRAGRGSLLRYATAIGLAL